MKKIKEFLNEFFKSKFNIFLTVLIALMVLMFLLSQFVEVLSLPTVFLLAINCFVIGVKLCLGSKKQFGKNRRYAVFLQDSEDEGESVEIRGNKNLVIIGVFLIAVAVFMLYTFIKML